MLYKVVTILSKKLRVREKPTTDSATVGYLYKDHIYTVNEYNDEWGYTLADDTDKGGYVSMAYLQPVEDQQPDKIAVYFTTDELKAMVDYINSLLGE